MTYIHQEVMALGQIKIVGLLVVMAAACGCERRTPTTQPTTSPATSTTSASITSFTTESISFSQGHRAVILTGTLSEGTVRRRQRVVVHTPRGPVEARIERIESTDGRYADLAQAGKGAKISLFFPQLAADEVEEGTRVTADEPR